MKTSYATWAPATLVELHSKIGTGKFKSKYTPEKTVSDLSKDPKFGTLTTDQLEDIKRQLYRTTLSLGEDEATELLGRLLRDERMRGGWAILDRRVKDENEYRRFWFACQQAIIGWRANEKLTTKERFDYYIEIHETALKLGSLLNKAEAFHFYDYLKLIEDKDLEHLLESLSADIVGTPHIPDGQAAASYARFCLHDIAPRIQSILMDISAKAHEYGLSKPIVTKPNSENAGVHYFIRTLTAFLRGKYDSPLYELVASTASVLLSVEIDQDYVRKVAQSAPGR